MLRRLSSIDTLMLKVDSLHRVSSARSSWPHPPGQLAGCMDGVASSEGPASCDHARQEKLCSHRDRLASRDATSLTAELQSYDLSIKHVTITRIHANKYKYYTCMPRPRPAPGPVNIMSCC